MTYKDKIQHACCGAVAAIIGAFLLGGIFAAVGYWVAFTCGVLCAAAAGWTAEIKDRIYGNIIDLYDILATVVGGALGAAIGATITLV